MAQTKTKVLTAHVPLPLARLITRPTTVTQIASVKAMATGFKIRTTDSYIIHYQSSVWLFGSNFSPCYVYQF
ncbi:MAG: hypothetical protein ACYC9T_09790 [Trichloromonadaceae bacterium]